MKNVEVYLYRVGSMCVEAFEREVGTGRAVSGNRISLQLVAILTENYSNMQSME
jgi:hypothetical protein